MTIPVAGRRSCLPLLMALAAGSCPRAAAAGSAVPPAYTLTPVQLSMGRSIPAAPAPVRRNTVPAKPPGATARAQDQRFAEALNRLTPKERKQLTKAMKRLSPEGQRQLIETLRRQWAENAATPHPVRRVR